MAPRPACLQCYGIPVVDILTRLGEMYAFDTLVTERIDFNGLIVSVVTPEMLYRMKRGTVRPRDWGDAQRIARRFGFKEE